MNYWGEPDSSVSFCEEKYKEVFWIAEYYNTLSSFFYVVIGYIFINSRVSRLAKSVMAIGIGSMFLHGTLRFYGQWLDEMSMIVACFFGLHEISPRKKPLRYLPFVLLIYIHCYKYFIIFLVIFSCINIYLIVHSLNKKWQNLNIFLYAVLFILGTGCWFIDQLFCEYVQHLYLHAWWHVLTASAIFFALLHMVGGWHLD